MDVAWHVDGTADALSFVRTLDGVEAVGLIGFRFGALVAALVADRGGVAHLGLVQPYVTGSHFLNEFLQTALFEQMFDTIGQQAETPRSLLDHLDSHEWKDLNGFRLTLQAYQRIIHGVAYAAGCHCCQMKTIDSATRLQSCAKRSISLWEMWR